MADALDLPADGRSISEALTAASDPDGKWLLRSIETLSAPGEGALALGELWQRTARGEVTISTRDLCEALVAANQVITLEACLLADPAIELFIDDGAVVVNRLPVLP